MGRATARHCSYDEIPVARRVYLPRRHTGPRLLSIYLIAFGSFLSVSVALIAQSPFAFTKLQGALSRAKVESHPTLDKRLLGHFPYPEVVGANLVDVAPGVQLHEEAAASLEAMRLAAASDGVKLAVLSGYRSHALQKRIFFEVKSERNQSAEERAKVSAPPGYSEHSTGYAVDLGDAKAPTTHLLSGFESTQAFRWLQDHAASYHFVLSFPPNNSQGVNYEPWHWRFEGSVSALLKFEAPRRLNQAYYKLP